MSKFENMVPSPRILAFLALVGLSLSIQAQNLAIIDVNIGGPEQPTQHMDVIVRDGKIAEIGQLLAVPTGFTRIEGKGLTLYAGFIDAYTTSGIKLPDAPAAATRPSATNTAPATMWDKNRAGIRSRVDAATNLSLADILQDAHKSGFTSALIAPGSGLARGSAVWTPISDSPDKPRPFGMAFSFRGGGGGGGYPGTTMASFALLRQTMYDARNPSLVGSGTTIDPDLQALSPAGISNGRAIFSVDVDHELIRAQRFCEEFNLKLVIAGGRDAFRRAAWFAETKTPVLVSLAIGDEPSITSTAGGTPEEILIERRETWKERAANIIKLHEAGAQFAFSSDQDPQGDFLKNVRKLVAMGLPKEAALRALTKTPAEILGIWDQIGPWGPGKRADFVLFSGDLFDSASVVKHAIVGGKVFSYNQVAN